ncbi:hypothetical protein E4V42_17775 [Clostridium estertheticum]|uniref:VCBS repeat-containing protein n=1 Tax=Clostridium estertheticum TaxID=238834 RepID=A0A5N7J5K9_9CLOT|nr:hypothetical protein [Clostridium estertheticum]MPQ33275.1 hypothetical protein [Clostridium estertheticum]MPQ63933.1 hypothetical protein [Clostridium estertheticum]
MKKKIISSFIVTLMITGSSSFSAVATIANGTVLIGNKSFELAYANDLANSTEITNKIIEGGAIYVKDFSGNWIDNTTGEIVDASLIPGEDEELSKGDKFYIEGVTHPKSTIIDFKLADVNGDGVKENIVVAGYHDPDTYDNYLNLVIQDPCNKKVLKNIKIKGDGLRIESSELCLSDFNNDKILDIMLIEGYEGNHNPSPAEIFSFKDNELSVLLNVQDAPVTLNNEDFTFTHVNKNSIMYLGIYNKASSENFCIKNYDQSEYSEGYEAGKVYLGDYHISLNDKNPQTIRVSTIIRSEAGAMFGIGSIECTYGFNNENNEWNILDMKVNDNESY